MYTIYVGKKSKLCFYIPWPTFAYLMYMQNLYIFFLTWDDPKFKLKFIVKWTKLQDDKIRIMNENS